MSIACKALAIAAAVVQLAAAVDLNNPLDGCPAAAQALADGENIFNSTGETSFKLNSDSEPWHLVLAFRDERARNTIYGTEPTRQSVDVILSVPESLPGSTEGSDTNLCIYRFSQQNGTANDQASCSGVLSDECIKALNNAPPAKDGACVTPDVSACGNLEVVKSSTKPLSFQDKNCSTNNTIPGTDNTPDGNQNYFTFASGDMLATDDHRSSYTEYDESILKPIPILITGKVGVSKNSTGNDVEPKLFCLAPSKIQAGSRAAVVSAGGATTSALLGAAKPLLLATLVSGLMVAF